MARYVFPVLVFILLTTNGFSQKLFPENVYDFLENPSITQINQEPSRIPLVPFASFAEAVKGERKASAMYFSLNGNWKFNFAETYQKSPSGFFKVDFNDKAWANIQVPGNWEMQGFGDQIFRNDRQPFNTNPPFVPRDYNPVGSYRKTFDLPKAWNSKQIFLRFEAISSAAFVWVNGQEVGYNAGAFEPSEFNITNYLVKGQNTISVQVFKYSVGSYLENQDYWRFSGIFRDVCLIASPSARIFDFNAVTDFDSEYNDAAFSVSASVKNYSNTPATNLKLQASLVDKQLKTIFKSVDFSNINLQNNQTNAFRFETEISKPEKWSAETPNLYTLVLELFDSNGHLIEAVSGKVGFREMEVKHQALCLNGVPLKLNGVNSHMQHPDLGHTVDIETMRKDLLLMKQFNINCVRTSHYPPNIDFLDLADEIGMYIIDEVGDEEHEFEILSHKPEWKLAYTNRAERTVMRDRLHPSIIFWSAGNESGNGDNICEVIKTGKKLDSTRLWMYGGNTDDPAWAHEVPCEDIIGPRYATPAELKYRIASVPEAEDPRPAFMDEYIAASGNGMGGLDEYWDVIWNNPRVIGGAIWDWVSPGIRRKVRQLTDDSPQKIMTTLNGNTTHSDGIRGKAVQLSGHDQWIDVYRHPALDVSGNQLSVSFWVKPQSWNGDGTFLTKGFQQFGLIQDSPNTIQFFVGCEKKDSVIANVPDNWYGEWHHLVGVYDGENISVYINGKIATTKINNEKISTSKLYTGNIKNRPFPVNIGRNPEIIGQIYSGYHSNAAFDEVRIFNRAVSIDSLFHNNPSLKSTAILWLDFETIQEQGEYYSLGNDARSYGLVWPDRKPQPELWQVKKSAQPVFVKAIDSNLMLFEITNRHSFTNLNEYDLVCRILADDKVVEENKIDVSLAPQKTMQVKMPYNIPQMQTGIEYRLLISFRLKHDLPWAKRGFEVAWEEFNLHNPHAEVDLPALNSSAVKVSKGKQYTVSGENFEYGFDVATGKLVMIKYFGTEMIKEGPKLNIWRAPVANELDSWTRWLANLKYTSGMGNDIANAWRSLGFDKLTYKLDDFQINQLDSSKVIVEVSSHSEGIDYHSFFEETYTYVIDDSGTMEITHNINPQGSMPGWLPCIGNQWRIDNTLSVVTWYGRGPFETYPDRKTGAKTGIYSATVKDIYEPYLVPQDYGLRTDNRWVKMSNIKGEGLEFRGAEWFDFSAHPYTTDQLTRARYPFQLNEDNATTFNFNHKTTGLGCTAVSVLNQYRVLPQKYQYSFSVRPIKTITK